MAREFVFRHQDSHTAQAIAQWCYDVIGDEARLIYQLSDRYPWYTIKWGFDNEFHFYNDGDAVQFALVWL